MNNSLVHPRSLDLIPAQALLFALALASGAMVPQPAVAQDRNEIAHPFFTHEGLPDPVGSYSMRGSGLATRIDGETKGDFAYHAETGLTERIGLHIRTDQFLQSRRSEVMLQFAAFKSKDGESGFAPIIELGVPTRSGGGKSAVAFGFTSKLANEQAAVNQAFHYVPSEKAFDTSVALVLRATERIYPVAEVLAEGGRSLPTIVRLLAGLKYRLSGATLIGVAYQRPVTSARELSSQVVVQLEFKLGTPRP